MINMAHVIRETVRLPSKALKAFNFCFSNLNVWKICQITIVLTVR